VEGRVTTLREGRRTGTTLEWCAENLEKGSKERCRLQRSDSKVRVIDPDKGELLHFTFGFDGNETERYGDYVLYGDKSRGIPAEE